MKKFTFLFVMAILTSLIFGSGAFGQITQVGSSETATTTSTTLTIDKPAGIAIGNVMIATITQSDDDGANGGDLSNPVPPGSGWTLIDGRQIGASGSGGDEWYGAVFYKLATAADLSVTSYAFALDSDADDGVGGIVAFRNVMGGNIFDVAPGTISTGNSDDLSATSITTATANAAVIMLGMIGDNRNVDAWGSTSPGALTELFDVPFNATLDMGVGAAWALKPATGATGAGTGELNGTGNDYHGSILIALRPVNPTVTNANLWSVSGTGALRKFTMDPITGQLLNGPQTVATPLVSTAAVAKNQITPDDAEGCIYYLNRDESSTLNGIVTVYSMRPDGTGHGSRGTIDMNGGGNDNDFSFVRLGFDALGRGWILAGSDGDGNIYIASFQGNGVNAISGVNTFGNASLTVAAPGTASEFQNGDLAITSNGTLYALANVTDGQTYIYTLNSLATPTTLSRRWTVQDNGGTFSGSVNGLAWTQSGSLHFSTSTGIYFIDQATANQGAGTVQAAYVPNSDGLSLTDLGSDRFPTQTTLPVNMSSFSVTKQGTNAVLNWTTATEINTDHFAIERSFDGIVFSVAGNRAAAGNSTDIINYQFIDPIASLTGVIYYRIKTIDIDGKVSFSKIVSLRLNGAVKNFTVYPNPFSSDLKIELEAAKDAPVTLRISNAIGQAVVNRNTLLQKGNNVIVLSAELSALKAGMYVIEIISEDGRQTQKIIKR